MVNRVKQLFPKKWTLSKPNRTENNNNYRLGTATHIMCPFQGGSFVWFSVACFGKELFTWLTIFSLCIRLFIILDISHFGFEGGIWGLITSGPEVIKLFFNLSSKSDSRV